MVISEKEKANAGKKGSKYYKVIKKDGSVEYRKFNRPHSTTKVKKKSSNHSHSGGSSNNKSSGNNSKISVAYYDSKGRRSHIQEIDPKEWERLKSKYHYKEVKKVSGRKIKQSEVNEAFSKDIGKIELKGGGTVLYSKSKMKHVITSVPHKSGESEAEYNYRRDTKILKAKSKREILGSQLTQRKFDTGELVAWKTPEKKIIITHGEPPAGMSEKVAKERGFVRVKTTGVKNEKNKGYKIKYMETETPKILKDEKASPRTRGTVPTITKVPIATPEEVKMALTGAYKIGKSEEKQIYLPEKEYAGYTVLEKSEEKIKPIVKELKYKQSPEYAIKVGKEAFAEMKKRGTLGEFEGLIASGMRPWSFEVAGTQVAESHGEVKKGTAKRLLYQRLGEEILRTKAEGITTEGFIRRLSEAPASVIGTPVVMSGVGSAFAGARSAIAGYSTKMTNAFDIVTAGLAGQYLGTRTAEIALAEIKEKNRPKVYEKLMLTSAEIGGVAFGANIVKGSVKGKPKELKPKGLMNLKLNTKELVSEGKVIGEISKGKFEMFMKTPEGKNVKVKGELKATTKDNISKGVITIPKQTVEGIEIKPQKILLKPEEVISIVSYGKQTKITKPVTEQLKSKDKVVGDVTKPETKIYQPYLKEGITINKELAFTKGTKFNLVNLMENINTKSNYIVNRYLKGGKPTKAQVLEPKLPSVKGQVAKYNIIPKQKEIVYIEKGVIEKETGKNILVTRLIGKTKEGIPYVIKEFRTKTELPFVEKTFFKTFKKPPRNIDTIYKDTVSDVNRQTEQMFKSKRNIEIRPKTETGRIIKEVEKIKVKSVEKPSAKAKLKSPKNVYMFDNLMENIRNNMNQVTSPIKTSERIQEKKRVVLKEKEKILPEQKVIHPKQEVISPITTVDEDYARLQDNLVDMSEQIRLEQTIEKPPVKPPEKIKTEGSLIGILGFPLNLNLGYGIDKQYNTVTKYVKHKIPEIEELFRW